MSRIFLDQSFLLTCHDNLVALAAIGLIEGWIWFFFSLNHSGGERKGGGEAKGEEEEEKEEEEKKKEEEEGPFLSFGWFWFV